MQELPIDTGWSTRTSGMRHQADQLIESLLWLAETGRDGALSLQIRLYAVGQVKAAQCEEAMTYIADALDGNIR